MTFTVKEIFYTLQGEGAQTGMAAVFCRFSGCNLWSGREQDRASAECQFCDTDFIGTDGINGGKFESSELLASKIDETWPVNGGRKLVVCTGGEPLLQLDEDLVGALHDRGFRVAVETNGTLEVPTGIDWVCVSPKAGTTCIVRKGNEIKLVFPQEGIRPEQFEGWDFDHFFIQPMDGSKSKENIRNATQYCQDNPHWRLSLQTHKILGIP